ncbi:ATP-binding protein [Streptomyces sp. WP-1]|uniref:ATP-binding protein n=1 Tax=Streptomyces sp. WP-1 TaxID=3041497 RepID=UPI00264A43E1|nr:ATP-binding protein [Streptomyces sp. WP-1]WKE68846.1 ATP-binding protein [Streptomyces sp. WP-1]
MIEIPELAFGGLAAGTVSALALGSGLWRSRRERARLRQEMTGLRHQAEQSARAGAEEAERLRQAFAAELEHLATRRMPAEASRTAHPHVPVPGPVGPEGAATEPVLAALRTAVLQERKRVDAAARAGMRGTTREIQASLYRLQDILHGLQQRYDEPELAQDLYSLDHENEQSLRRAQVAAVVCGAWVGLAREESHLVDAVTGGQARLSGYRRVKLHNHLDPGTALVSHAVEPVAIIAAELLDNALRHSSPDTSVVVNLEHVHNGVTVTVDDAGVGMAPDERAAAQRVVGGTDPIMFSDLGDPPRMGLAAIGQLTRQFDLSVDLSTPSPYGGVRAVLLVDRHLLSHIDPALRPAAASTSPSTRTGEVPRPEPLAEHARHAKHVQHPGQAKHAEHVQHPGQVKHAEHTHAPAQPVPDSARQASGLDRPAPGHDRPVSGSERPSPGDDRPTPGPDRPAPAADDLPRRRRRQVSPDQAAMIRPSAAETAAPARSPEETAAALGALQSATAAARDAARSEGTAPR